MSDIILSIKGTQKTYQSGVVALKPVDLDIKRGEIFALLGPNGAGKTTLISIICALVRPSGGTIVADGHDIAKEWRAARQKIGLVPQELHTDAFETVFNTVRFSRGLFGLAKDDDHIEKVLKDLSLWDKKDSKITALSGGMKRRVMIAKALAHEPKILFLDEPSAGVDVELRRDMWAMVRRLKEAGVTIILTTHYIEEAEEMADRIGMIRQGELFLVEETKSLMQRLGARHIRFDLVSSLASLPASLAALGLSLSENGEKLDGEIKPDAPKDVIMTILRTMDKEGLAMADFKLSESSLEDIFVSLVHENGADEKGAAA